MKTIVIDRKRWGRGEEGGFLRCKSSKKQCCLGFVCRAFGVSPQRISNVGMPYNLSEKTQQKLPKWLLVDRVDNAVNKAAEVNDQKHTDDATKEKEIAKIFARNGLKAKFVG